MNGSSNTPRERLPYLGVRYTTGYNLCNLDCPYCFAEWKIHRQGLDGERFRAIIAGIERLPYRIRLRLGIGGEAFTCQDILDEVCRLSHEPDNILSISFSSNIEASWDSVIRPFLEVSNTGRLGIGCTLHDTVIKDVDRFFEKARLIKEAGVEVYVGFVALPGRLDLVRRYKERCEALGVRLLLNAYVAPRDENERLTERVHQYPDESKAELRELYDDPHQYELGIERKRTLGMRCSAGHGYIHVDRHGWVYPCSHTKTRLGSLLKGDVELRSVDSICPMGHCWCPNQNQALRIVDEKYERSGRTLRVVEAKSELSIGELHSGYGDADAATLVRALGSRTGPRALGHFALRRTAEEGRARIRRVRSLATPSDTSST